MKAMEHYSGVSIMGFARSANVYGNHCQATSVGSATKCGLTTMQSKTSSRQLSRRKSIKQGV